MGMQPKLRFKGFTDDWEKRKLENFTKSYSGGTPSISRSDYYGGEIPFIRSAEINSDSTDLYLTEIGLKNSSAKMVQYGDILYALYGATSGEVGIARIHGAINQAILAIKPTDGDDSQFIMQWLRKQKGHIINTYLQGGQGNLSGSIVKSLEVRTPVNKNEEFKIGSLLKKIDNLITVNQRKVDLLKRKKAGYLQKLFPKNGQNNPELRFKGYTDAWEKRKLNEIAKFNPKSTLPDVFEYVDLESVVGTKMINHRTETKTNAPSRAQRVAKFGDVFYQTVRPYQKNNYLFKINGVKYVFSTGYAQLRPKYSSEFLLARIQENMFVRKVLDRSTGTSYPAINSNDLAKIEITIPNSAEQENIGMLFLTLDNLIAVNQDK